MLESSLILLSWKFSDEEEIRQKAKAFFSAVKSRLKMDIDNVCLNNIHASILVGNLCGAEGESVSEGLFSGKCSFTRDILRKRSV